MNQKYFLCHVDDVKSYVMQRLRDKKTMPTNLLKIEGREIRFGLPRYSQGLLRKALRELRKEKLITWHAQWYGQNAGYTRIYEFMN